MVQAERPQITLAWFLTLPETTPASEFIDGEILRKPMPKGRHSRLQGALTSAINQAAEPGRIALALPELRCSFGTRSIVPDIAVFTWERIPFTPDQDIPDDFDLPPDWMIEILSPDQSPIRVIDNLLYGLRFGSRLGWLISPAEQRILVFRPGQEAQVWQGDQGLPVLPPIPLALTPNQIFAWLRFPPQG
jgi:Uma2 family endonuclease